MKKPLAITFVVICGVLLGGIVVQDVLSVLEEVTTDFSVMEFEETPNGSYAGSILIITAYDMSASMEFTVPFLHYCNCSRKYFEDGRREESECRLVQISALYDTLLKNGTVIKLKTTTVLVENPQSFRRQESLSMECATPEIFLFSFITLPIPFDSIFALMQDLDAGIEYFETHFFSRPYTYLSSGRFSLIQLSEKQFADSNGQVAQEDRHIYSAVSSTSSGQEKRSKMTFIWATSIVEKVSVVKRGNYLQVAKVVATFVLASERVYAIYGRVTR